jgi:hypothetical protein
MDANLAVTQFTAAGVAVWAIQQLKNASWFPWLKQNGQAWGKRLLSIATAIGIHTGIGYVWNAGTPPTGYQYQLIINIPAVSIIAITMWHWLSQYVLQEAFYQVSYNRVTLTSTPEGRVAPAQVTEHGQLVIPKTPEE